MFILNCWKISKYTDFKELYTPRLNKLTYRIRMFSAELKIVLRNFLNVELKINDFRLTIFRYETSFNELHCITNATEMEKSLAQ